jgi:hypothetical protein
MADLPKLMAEDLWPTRDYLRDVTLAMGSLQRGFLKPHPREWQHGLEVNMRGPLTQPFSVNDHEFRASLDIVAHKVRLGDVNWKLDEYNGAEIFNNFKVWLVSQGVKADIEQPEFSKGSQYDKAQAEIYAEALWWLNRQFRTIKATLSTGVTSPILLYPHHFDLSLTWFPWGDERQLGFGWSTGDETIAEPYIYLTAYPQPQGFTKLELPPGAYWQSKGFSGAILLYSELQASGEPDILLQKFALDTFQAGQKLFG